MIIRKLNKCLLLLALSIPAALQGQQKTTLTRYVNPFIGTAPMNDPKILGYQLPEGWRSWAGLTFPGSSLPNAMVQLSPVTAYGSGAGYQYEDSVILGFTHTNKGHWNLCNIPILPVSGSAERTGSRFSHKNEKASPGFYQVYLDDYGVEVSLTSTLRAGFHKYAYKDSRNRRILFDLGKANSRVSTWFIKQVGDHAVEGFQGGENVYFYAELNTGIKNITTKDEGKRTGSAMIYLTDGTSPVELKIGLSFVSTENARLNLQKEIGNKSFETIKKDANETWEKLLSSIQVKGGTAKQRRMFYSCFYRSFLWPALRSDINNEYRDVKKNVVTAGGFRYYTEPSLWDTYRNKDVLLGLITPDVTLDVIKSMKAVGDKTGFIPTFFHGDHGASSIAGAYLRGIDNFDIKGTYQLLLRNANVEGGARPFISEYIKKGYISDPNIQNPQVETKAKAGVSKTLEYAYDDYSVAQIAKRLGDTANYRILMARSKNYRNVFDPSTRFMRGRLDNGEWIKNFDPQQPYYEYMYREANAWQVSFFAPHDMQGLIELYGGPEKIEKKLDSLFTVPWNPKHIARNVETMIGQYCQGNQPDHEAPFAYTLIGKPAKTQKVLDFIMNNLYGIGEKGLELSGMDDAGEMSSWYVFSAIGLYPFSATDPDYLVTAPLFDRVEWKTPHGTTVVINKPAPGRSIKGIKVNGKKLDGYFVSHDLFKNGGQITIETIE